MSLPRITDQFVCGPAGTDPLCPRCGGTGTVCEDHRDLPWGPMHALGCACGAAGMPCQGDVLP